MRLKKKKRRKKDRYSGKPGSVCVLKVLKERTEVVVLSFVTSKNQIATLLKARVV